MKNLTNNVLQLIFSDNLDDYVNELATLLNSYGVRDYTVWSVSGNICSVASSSIINFKATLDIFELGYDRENIFVEPKKDVSFFTNKFFIAATLFIRHKDFNLYAITFHSTIKDETKEELTAISPFLGKRAYELYFKEKQMDLYIDYQKKVDFIKKGSKIFKALDIPEVVALSLSFFMEVFSADASFAIHKGVFSGVGVSEDDISKDITADNTPLRDYLMAINETVYSENLCSSKKFNIKNVFFVFDPVTEMKFVLFNINVDIVPDKEFSELVTNIVSIAAENALNHQKMIGFKLEETEMHHTVDILNRFVKRTISYDNTVPEIYAVNFPARSAGGDFVDVVRLDDKIIFAVADVCGKGYSAAVFTVVLSVFSSITPNVTISEAVKQMNDFLIHKNFADRFITGFFGIVDVKKNELEYISCGHDPAFILSKNMPNVALSSDYLPLGLIDEEYKSTTVKIPNDSVLFVYTDGLIEYTDYDNLCIKVRALAKMKSREIAETLYKDLVTEPSLQRDDFTCIIMKF